MHYPVMLDTVLEYLAPRPGSVILEATTGLGGHTAAIAERVPGGLVIACDRDAESLEIAKRNASSLSGRIRFEHCSFSELPAALARAGVQKVNRLLADLGASRFQLTDAERGFSFLADGPLDMRMNRSKRGGRGR
jgi:16S rRNA (cytosine1402-N4)-methyltransferase